MVELLVPRVDALTRSWFDPVERGLEDVPAGADKACLPLTESEVAAVAVPGAIRPV